MHTIKTASILGAKNISHALSTVSFRWFLTRYLQSGYLFVLIQNWCAPTGFKLGLKLD